MVKQTILRPKEVPNGIKFIPYYTKKSVNIWLELNLNDLKQSVTYKTIDLDNFHLQNTLI